MTQNLPQNIDGLTNVAPEPVSVTGADVPELPDKSRRGVNVVDVLHIIQKWSVVPMTAFAAVHLPAVIAAPGLLGMAAADDLLMMGRELYSLPGVELTMAIGAGLHLAAGAGLYVHRALFRSAHGTAHRWSPLRTSGWLLAGVLAGHVWFARWGHGPGVRIGLPSVARALKHDVLSWLALGALVSLGAFHGVGGAKRYLRAQFSAKKVLWGVAALAALSLTRLALTPVRAGML